MSFNNRVSENTMFYVCFITKWKYYKKVAFQITTNKV